MKAYVSSIINENLEIRGFSEKVDVNLLEWHRDAENRCIFVESGAGWLLQLDNELPVTLEKGKIYQIPAMEYHRVIKGEGNLKIKIWEEK